MTDGYSTARDGDKPPFNPPVVHAAVGFSPIPGSTAGRYSQSVTGLAASPYNPLLTVSPARTAPPFNPVPLGNPDRTGSPYNPPVPGRTGSPYNPPVPGRTGSPYSQTPSSAMGRSVSPYNPAPSGAPVRTGAPYSVSAINTPGGTTPPYNLSHQGSPRRTGSPGNPPPTAPGRTLSPFNPSPSTRMVSPYKNPAGASARSGLPYGALPSFTGGGLEHLSVRSQMTDELRARAGAAQPRSHQLPPAADRLQQQQLVAAEMQHKSEQLRMADERRQQQQAVSQHFDETFRRMHHKTGQPEQRADAGMDMRVPAAGGVPAGFYDRRPGYMEPAARPPPAHHSSGRPPPQQHTLDLSVSPRSPKRAANSSAQRQQDPSPAKRARPLPEDEQSVPMALLAPGRALPRHQQHPSMMHVPSPVRHQPAVSAVKHGSGNMTTMMKQESVPMSMRQEEAVPVPISMMKQECGSVPVSMMKQESGSVPVSMMKQESGSVPVSMMKQESGYMPVSMMKQESGSVSVSMMKQEAGPVPISKVKQESGSVPLCMLKPESGPAPVNDASTIKHESVSGLNLGMVLKPEGGEQPPQYAHKLKKAWLQRLANNDPAPGQLSPDKQSRSEPSSPRPVQTKPCSALRVKSPVQADRASSPKHPMSAPNSPKPGNTPQMNDAVQSSAQPSDCKPPADVAAEHKSSADGSADSTDGGVASGRGGDESAPAACTDESFNGTSATTEQNADENGAQTSTDVADAAVQPQDSSESDSGADSPAPARSNQRKLAVKPKSKVGRKQQFDKKAAKKRAASKRVPISVLKKTGESFLQDIFCSEITSKLPKCRECRLSQHTTDTSSIYCRFTSFRRLRYTRTGLLAVAGFCDPHQDAGEEDQRLWLPGATARLELQVARHLLQHVGAQFCQLVEEEEQALRCHLGADGTVAWKRVVQGCREMCDVCETTLFNMHWVCSKCGFAVCVDCYVIRRDTTGREPAEADEPQRTRDRYQWLLCNNRQAHEQERLMLTQIVAGDSLATLNRRVHAARHLAGLPSCQCPEAKRQQLEDGGQPTRQPEERAGPAVAARTASSSSDTDSDEDGPGGAGVRQLLEKMVDGGKQTIVEEPQPRSPPGQQGELQHYRRRGGRSRARWDAGMRMMTLTESRRLYPAVAHSWLCDGKLLRLEPGAADSPDCVRLFRDQWRHGQPVICSGVGTLLQPDLWSVESFIRDFGDVRHDLLSCTTGNIVPKQPMRNFWEGFGCVAKRLRDDSGQPMILKVKDWPPGEDFSDLMPRRFEDVMSVLPMGEYTRRDGRLNLACCLPDCFVRPDLGPKMYIAYGCAQHPSKASTNLHLDISDAVNIMVHVVIPPDDDVDSAGALRAIDEAGCDPLTKQRVRDERPGALWHIYRAADADKIRDLLNKVSIERGDRLERHHDPIHDQSWYLDGPLRRRLYGEYGVEGFPIVQCAGDALFVPAGAPHQVRNLHSCIKVAEDFVSPENVGHCFDLTQEFRSLSDTHTNHEDKLQIKNIVYHAMKEAVSSLPSDETAVSTASQT